MNSLFSILFKNLVLLAIITVSLIFIFTPNIGYKEVRYIFLGLGLLYVVASCLEAYKLSQVNKGTKKFIYFTDGFITKRVIKIISFACCGVVLLYSDSIIKYMAFLCFIIAFTEIVVTIWRHQKHLCFIAFENDALVISTNKLSAMRAHDILKIETRHGLTYFINTKNKAFTVRTDMMDEKEEFRRALNNWIQENHLSEKVFNE